MLLYLCIVVVGNRLDLCHLDQEMSLFFGRDGNYMNIYS